MKYLLVISILISILAFSFASDLKVKETQSSNDAPDFKGYVENEIVVKFDKSLISRMNISQASITGQTTIAALDRIGNQFDISSMIRKYPKAEVKVYKGRTIDLSLWFKVKFDTKIDAEAVAGQYRAVKGVIDAQPIGVHKVNSNSNDPENQYHISQSNDHDIDAPEAWDIETGDGNIILTILDTGVRYYHKDLGGANASSTNTEAARGNMWINWSEKNGSAGVDDDNNGYTDDWIGWDFVTGKSGVSGEDDSTPDNDPRDFNGHGTHTSGIAAAINNNGYAVASPAGGWNNGSQAVEGNGIKIMALRIGWSGKYFIWEVGYVDMGFAADAFYYAADNGARLASCSWGSSNSGGIEDAIDYFLASGGLIFKSAGNGGDTSTDYMTGRSDIIAVASTDENDVKSDFSSYGSWVDISAPGSNIVSTYHDHYDAENDYVTSLSGTSMSSPMAAGVAGLIWSKHPDWTADQVKQRLFDTADDIDGIPGNSSYAGQLGAGRINAYSAVNDGSGPVAPVAAFSGTPTSGDVPLSVSFTDESTNSPTSWSWDFGDGANSTIQNPTHEYSTAGTYTVSLTAANSAGSDTETKTDYITVNEPAVNPPVAAFSGAPTSGNAPLSVSFTDESTNTPTSWSWDFGDGANSTVQNPTHEYSTAGAYTVSLTATNSAGSDTETKTDYINVTTASENAMHVKDITMVKETFYNFFYRGRAEILIVDAYDAVVEEAVVSGSWSGAASDQDEAATASDGIAIAHSDWSFGNGEFTFTVDNVSKSGWVYDESANVVTSASTDGSSSSVETVSNISLDEIESEADFKFAYNSPNPFNPTTTINFIVPAEAHVRVDIFNILGQRVNSLLNKPLQAGLNSVRWNADDKAGNKVGSGTYFYKITFNSKYTLIKKILLLK